MGEATVTNAMDIESSGEGEFKILSLTLETPSARECLGVGELEVCITFWPGTNWSLGPVYREAFDLDTRVDEVWDATFQLGGFNSPQVNPFDIVPRPIVEVVNVFVPSNTPGVMNLFIDDAQEATNVGHEGTTGRHILEPGTHKIHVTAGTATTLDHFVTSISCVDLAGDVIASGNGAILTTLELTGGEDVVCTVTNRLPIGDACLENTYDNFFLLDASDNVVNGTNGRDIIIGYGGKDTLNGLDGDDCIAGGDGDDKIYGTYGHDIIYGDDGKDTISGGTGNNLIFGGADDDTLDGGIGHDVIHGDGGRDNIQGGNGLDEIHGGDDNDTINGGNDADTVNGDGGADTIKGGNGNDTIFGGDGNDSLFGDNGNDYLNGEGDNDTLNGGVNTDTCIGERRTLCERLN